MEEGKDIDWATAEALAMGSLLYQGRKVVFDFVFSKFLTISGCGYEGSEVNAFNACMLLLLSKAMLVTASYNNCNTSVNLLQSTNFNFLSGLICQTCISLVYAPLTLRIQYTHQWSRRR